MAESSIAKALRISRENIEKSESEKSTPRSKNPKKRKPKKKGLIDSIRSALSSDENVSRIDAALEAVEGGIADADKDAKRKK